LRLLTLLPLLPNVPQMVRQTRVPTALPEVLVINCGMQDRADVAWWQPRTGADGKEVPWCVLLMLYLGQLSLER
jgi:hypothetical protein